MPPTVNCQPSTVNCQLSTVNSPAALPYNSTASVWLSVDPLSDKYPSVSPYVYCAGNPVVMKDPNGEDYEVVVDNEKKTITIRATFFTSKNDASTLRTGIKLWTDQASDQYTYTTETMEYSIVFDFIINEYQSYSEASEAYPNDSRTSGSNMFAINYDFLDDKSAKGECNGYNITVATAMNSRTAAHEIGHALGIDEDKSGQDWLMASGGKSTDISPTYIIRILHNVGLRTQIRDDELGIGEFTSASSPNQYDFHGIFEEKNDR